LPRFPYTVTPPFARDSRFLPPRSHGTAKAPSAPRREECPQDTPRQPTALCDEHFDKWLQAGDTLAKTSVRWVLRCERTLQRWDSRPQDRSAFCLNRAGSNMDLLTRREWHASAYYLPLYHKNAGLKVTNFSEFLARGELVGRSEKKPTRGYTTGTTALPNPQAAQSRTSPPPPCRSVPNCW